MSEVCQAADDARRAPNQALSMLLAAVFFGNLLVAMAVSLVQLAPDVLMPLW